MTTFNPLLSTNQSTARRRMSEAYHRDEAEAVAELIRIAELDSASKQAVHALALDLVKRVRAKKDAQSAVESFMRQYDLSSDEGVLLMCVAEALLRIPDAETADKLISDKLGEADWAAHQGKSDSMFVNAGTWGLMLTGKIVKLADDTKKNFSGALRRLIGRAGEPMVRTAVRQAMKIMGHQFVMGRTIQEALARARDKDNRAYRHSYDMLGESAFTAADAERYFVAYQKAIDAIGESGPYADLSAGPSISVKLSALHPRYEKAKQARVMAELTPKVLQLAQLAKRRGIAMTIDAEEADRLELSLDIIEQVYADPSLDGWTGFGLAVQAYQKRAVHVIDELAELAKRVGRRLCVRLVKGAYWDSEVKRAQIDGHVGYPVFTRKHNTDLSYLACARRLFAHGDLFYPQFATHNAQTIACIHTMAKGQVFEFQRLHGMGADLYAEVIPAERLNAPCRIYAPVGSHEDLLPYLVRRLLENGANTSFVNRIVDESIPPEALIEDPIELAKATEPKAHPRIALPINVYGSARHNSRGINFASDVELSKLAKECNAAAARKWRAEPLVPGLQASGPTHAVSNPSDRRQIVGDVQYADSGMLEHAIAQAVRSQAAWNQQPVELRAQALERAADLLEERRAEFMTLCTLEAGKTLADGIAEVREGADFCRYYAQQARRELSEARALVGPTGESNHLCLHGRGVFVCISPWNFPLAIFLGQVVAALVTGNSVLAKPAEQTCLIAYQAVKLLHEAGIPAAVLQYLPGEGATIGAALTRDPRIAGVCFTGSTETARAINRTLADRDAPIATLIAETGGQNALFADSSALPEQVVRDVISSAFGSAGQRCSAARILVVQDDIADKVLHLLAGAMDELALGDPANLATDIGPVIDDKARASLQAHITAMTRDAKLIKALATGEAHAHGSFVPPHTFEIQNLAQLKREQFGPILHVLRFKSRELDSVIDQLNALGYGLTMGIHSRIDATIKHISQRVRAGNCYVNRNMIGAVVGVQPFGGEGLSGTGPKAGGPHYLHRFVSERTLTINTAAVGGNASLLAQGA